MDAERIRSEFSVPEEEVEKFIKSTMRFIQAGHKIEDFIYLKAYRQHLTSLFFC